MSAREAVLNDPHALVRNTRPFFVGWCIYAVIVMFLGRSVMGDVSASFDFRALYAAGYQVRTEPSKLYDPAQQWRVQDALVSRGDLAFPFYHPSYEALLFAPFSLLRYSRAYLCFMMFNLILLAILFISAYPLFSTPMRVWQPRPGLMFFPFLPLFLTIWHGQDSVVFLLLCSLVCMRLEKGADLSAGCMLALGLFKFHVAIPLAILCAVRRSWRFSAGFLTMGAAVAALCAALVGRSGMVSLLHLLSAASLAHDQSAAAQTLMAIHPKSMPNLVGLLTPLTQRMAARPALVMVAGVSAGVFVWCLYLMRRATDERVAFAMSMICALLVSYHMNITDEALVLLPLALLSRQLSKAALFAIYLLPLAVLFLGGANWIFLLAIPTLWILRTASRLIQPSRPVTAPVTA
jgi:hypothetical protein